MSHYTNKQKEHRNRKEKRKLNEVEAQAETENGMLVPVHAVTQREKGGFY